MHDIQGDKLSRLVENKTGVKNPVTRPPRTAQQTLLDGMPSVDVTGCLQRHWASDQRSGGLHGISYVAIVRCKWLSVVGKDWVLSARVLQVGVPPVFMLRDWLSRAGNGSV